MGSFKTVEQIGGESEFSKATFGGPEGDYLKYEMIPADEVNDLQISTEYQRTVSSKSILRQYRKFDRQLCSPIMVADHPKFGRRIIDGQHRAIMHFLCGDTEPLPALVYYEDASMSEAKCLKEESRLFWKTNTQKKKLKRTDELRAGVQWGDSLSIHCRDTMEIFDVALDNFGAKNPDYIVQSFNQFYLTLKAIRDDKVLQRSFKIWKDLWGSKMEANDQPAPFHGVMFKTCTLIQELIKEEGVDEEGVMNHLRHYAKNNLHRKAVDGRIDANCHRYVLNRMLEGYHNLPPNLPDKYSNPEDLVTNQPLT